MIHQPIILVVDDEPNNIEMLAGMLDDQYELRFAVSAQEALTAIKEMPKPDLILLDVMLPDMNGYAICERIKEDPATADIPIIFVTSLGDPEQEEKGFAVGGADYIVKPCRALSIKARIRNQLEMKRTRELLHRLAITDGLTSLANRRHFDEALKQEMQRLQRQGGQLSLVLIDVDFFKRFNDYYGHPAGDECLRRIAAVIATELRRPADLTARIGGEEFACLLPETSLAGAYIVAERIRQTVLSLKMPHQSSTISDYVTVSVGVATSSGTEAAHLYQRADIQLYIAKTSGRNCVVQDVALV
ncbi:diguanylate cyclase domain-containing protein [Iodobacter arcticus]|uniref:diguanylate cyclase n=1 Tax=Iodobacter arcticus TaxID=590593 RepID=A0ABW2QZL2_9NEIS